MSLTISTRLFSDLPVELINEYFKHIDDIKTITRLLSTCKFIYELKIEYKINLIRTSFNSLIWTRNPTLISEKGEISELYLQTNNLEQYYKALKYQHILRTICLPTITILGLNTDLPYEILNSPSFKLSHGHFGSGSHLKLSKIRDYKTHRHMFLKNKNILNCVRIEYEDHYDHLNIVTNSEILRGCHSIYNNIKHISHTATEYFMFNDIKYFISFYTKPMILF